MLSSRGREMSKVAEFSERVPISRDVSTDCRARFRQCWQTRQVCHDSCESGSDGKVEAEDVGAKCHPVCVAQHQQCEEAATRKCLVQPEFKVHSCSVCAAVHNDCTDRCASSNSDQDCPTQCHIERVKCQQFKCPASVAAASSSSLSSEPQGPKPVRVDMIKIKFQPPPVCSMRFRECFAKRQDCAKTCNLVEAEDVTGKVKGKCLPVCMAQHTVCDDAAQQSRECSVSADLADPLLSLIHI